MSRTPTGPSPGLRERKKEATRQALHDQAVRLVLERGLDAVTVEAIADAAMVSRRTFSNYFSNKEEAVLHRDSVRARRLVELVEARPAGEEPWRTLCAAAEELVASGDVASGDVASGDVASGDLNAPERARLNLGRLHPSLLAHRVATYAAVERALADVVLRRTPGLEPLTARLLAATLMTTLRVTVEAWGESPEEPLPQLLHRALAAVRSE